MSAVAKEIAVTLADYNDASCLIYGIGNVGRQDDGLGWAFIDWLEEESICPNADLDKHYQLHLEHADLISHKKKVLFVDATLVPEVDSFKLENVDPEMDQSFTSHAISIGAIMETSKICFDFVPEVQLLTIKGYEWELQLGLTSKAQQNLEQAKNFFIAQSLK